jgi:predicted transcriptional regulator with HTH domain
MKISDKKRDKILEQILAYLYSISPKSAFTFTIAQEIARDEEFVKSLLLSLKKKNFVLEVKKSPKGVVYSKRSRWALTDHTYTLYKQRQNHLL